jgi:hypothetical protein
MYIAVMAPNKPKVVQQDKVQQDKASDTTACTDANELSWIPVSKAGIDGKDKKPGTKLTATLDLKYISTNLDKFGRNVCYFSCSNPEALYVVKQDMDTQGLNPEIISLPFWQGSEGDYLLRVSKQNLQGLADDELQVGIPINRLTEFRYYSGKRNSGYTIII